MKNKILSLLLVLCMIVTLLPTMAIRVGATDGIATRSGTLGPQILSGTYLLDNVTINASGSYQNAIMVSGSCTLIIKGTVSLTGGQAYAGIKVTTDSSLTILGNEGTANSLIVRGGAAENGLNGATGGAGSKSEAGYGGEGGRGGRGAGAAIGTDGALPVGFVAGSGASYNKIASSPSSDKVGTVNIDTSMLSISLYGGAGSTAEARGGAGGNCENGGGSGGGGGGGGGGGFPAPAIGQGGANGVTGGRGGNGVHVTGTWGASGGGGGGGGGYGYKHGYPGYGGRACCYNVANRSTSTYYCELTSSANPYFSSGMPTTASASNDNICAWIKSSNFAYPGASGSDLMGGVAGLSADKTGGNGANSSTDTTTASASYRTVCFNANGGSANSYAMPTGNTVGALPTSNPTRENYTFKGWNTRADGNGSTVSTSTTLNDIATTYYAVWERNLYDAAVTVKKDGAAWTDAADAQVVLSTSDTAATAGQKTAMPESGVFTFDELDPSATLYVWVKNNAGAYIKADSVSVSSTDVTVNYYTVALTKGTGIDSVTGSGTYLKDETAKISAALKSGYNWSKWSDGDTTMSERSITVSKKYDLTATATAIPATAPTVNTTGATLTYGYTSGSISVSAEPASGHTITGYQWYENSTTNSVTGGTEISGATSSTYNVPKGKAVGTYYYYCNVSTARTDNSETTTVTTTPATSVTVNQKDITVKMNDKSRKYGESNPAFDFSITSGELADGDTFTDLAATGATTATAASNAAAYDITGTSESVNYNVTINSGTLTVNKKESQQTDFIYDLSAKTYNGAPQGITVVPKAGTATIIVKYNGLEEAPVEPGIYPVTIDVSGATNYADTTALSLGNYTINKTEVGDLSLTSSKNPSIYGDDVTYTVTVAKANASCLMPTGNIVFKNGETILATVALENGAASVTKSDLPAPSNSITAKYNGDDRYNEKASSSLEQTVNAKPIRFTIEGEEHFYESGTERNITIKDTASNLTANDFVVKYYLIDENYGELSKVTPVTKAVSAGKYLYVIDFKNPQTNYELTRKFTVLDTTLPDINNFDNVGYMDIKSSQSGQQKPISFRDSVASVYVTDGSYTNTLTNENASEVTYKSNNENVAVVATDGTVTVKKAGTATITATSEFLGTTPVYASYVLTVNKKPVTITANDDTVSFGTAWDKSTTVTYSDSLSASDFTGAIDFYTNYTQGSKVSEYEIKPTGLTSEKYEITFVSAKLTVTPKALELSDFTVAADSKTYDGTKTASVRVTSISGLYSGNSVKAEIEGAFTSANASDNANVSYTITGLSGKDADNYILDSNMSGVATAKIGKAPVSVICSGNTTRIYDGSVQSVDVTAMANGQVLDSSSYDVRYNDTASPVDVGSYTVAIELKDKLNYVVNPFVASLTIKSATQDVFSIEYVPNAVYYGDNFTVSAEGGQNGNIVYSITGAGTINPVTGEVAITGTGKITISATKTITGYAPRVATRSFTAMKKIITPISNIADSITYNGQTNVDVLISFADGDVLLGDAVSATSQATRIDTNAGNDKLVYVKNIALTGDKKNYYTLSTTNLQDTIDVIPIEVTSFTISPENKVYDGTDTASAKVTSINGVLSSDLNDVLVSGSAKFNTADTTATTVTYTIENITGSKSGNYNFTSLDAHAAATIYKAKVDFSVGSVNFVYDGTPKTVNMTATSGNNKFTAFTVKYNNGNAVPVNAGNYEVSVLLNDTQNYETSFTAANMKIITADQKELTVSGMPGTLEYSKEFVLTVTGGSNTGGNLAWQSSDDNIATVDNSGRVKITGVNKEVTLTATKSGGENFNDEIATVVFTPVAKQVQFRISNLNQIFDGTHKDVTVVPSDLNMINTQDYSITYFDQNSNNLTEVPTDAGTYYVEVKSKTEKYLGSSTAMFTIKKANMASISVTQNNGTYQTTLDNAAINGTVPSGVTSQITYVGSGIVTPQAEKPTKAGTYTIIATFTGSNYETYTATNTFTIAPKKLTINDFSIVASNKTFNDITDAILTVKTIGISEDVKADVIGAFTSANASDNANVSYTITGLSGKDADNYILDTNMSGTTTAKIEKAPVSIICASNTTRTFDGNVQSVDISAMANGSVFDNNNLVVWYDGKTAPSAVGTYNVTITLTDEAEDNYTVKDFAATLTIKAAVQEVFSIEGIPDKVSYGDCFTISTLGAQGNVEFTINNGAPAEISESTIKATGTGIVTITATSKKEGYTDKVATRSFTVSKRELTPSAVAVNRGYNGESNVDISIDLENVITGDDITAAATGTMTTADAGNSKIVYVSGITLSGDKKDLYTLSATSTQTTADIAPAEITAFEISADNKTYDGTNNADVTITSITGVLDADKSKVSINGNAVFENEIAGNDKIVTFTAASLTGSKAENYVLTSQTANATADINAMNVTFHIGTATFKYDGGEKEITVSATDAAGRLFNDFIIEYYKDGTACGIPQNAGDYTARIVLTDDVNYKTTQNDIAMSIAEAMQEQITIVGLPGTVEYTDSFELEAVGGSGAGEFEWMSDNNNVTVIANDSDSSKATVKVIGAVGDRITVKAKRLADGNYEEKEGITAFIPTQKMTSFILDDMSQVYGSTSDVAVSPSVPDADYKVFYNGSASVPTDVGTYNVLVTATGNYKGSATGTLIIRKAKMNGLTVSQEDNTYGTELDDPVYSDAPNGVNVKVAYSTADGSKPKNAGDYTVTATYMGDNYETFVVSDNFKINKKELIVKANDANKAYGEANPVFTISYNGFVYGENESNLLSEPIVSSSANAQSDAKDYELKVSGGRADN